VQTQPPAEPPPWISPHLLGTVCGLFSAFIYTCANSFLRAVHDCDPVWVSAIRAVPTVAIMGPVLVVLACHGQRVLPPPRFGLLILLGGLSGQLGGNICFQSSLHVIGVALAVPLTMGGMIVSSAILGRLFLAEPITPRVLLALAILLSAIGVLIVGASDAARAMSEQASGVREHQGGADRIAGLEDYPEAHASRSPSPWRLAAGVAGACGAGMFYTILNAILRYCVTRGTPLPTSLFIVSITGMLSLSGLAWCRIGASGIVATTSTELSIMLAAGVCNTVAFLALTKSLQLNSIVYVNALNATQATLAALAGVLIFREKLSPWLIVGIGLTIVGLMALAKAHRAMREPEAL
jgi:drug/metabolite transporter (DMT)-like permease